MFTKQTLRAALIVGVTTLSLYGCSDSLAPLDQEPGLESSETVSASDSKFRNQKFVRQAMRKRMGKDGEENYLGIIIGLNEGVSAQKVVERMKILERQKILERNKVLERGQYEEVFNGVAIEVNDIDGLGNYYPTINLLLTDPDVAWFEPDLSMLLPNSTGSETSTGQRIPWSVAEVGGMESWTASGNGSGSVSVDVYVLDTGVSNDDINVVESVKFADQVSTDDVDGHGTHIAAIIGAIDDGDGVVGIAPGARIHNFKVLNDDGTAPTTVVLDAFEELIARKKKDPTTPMVVNLSLGENVGVGNDMSLDEAVESAINSGIVVVVSAGNWGIDVENVTPARVPGAITVGAYDFDGRFSYFSNYGSNVDILAPGEGIPSLMPKSFNIVTMSGTSMAAGHVTGAAALYLAQNPKASPAEVEKWIKSNGRTGISGVPSMTASSALSVADPGSRAKKLLFVVPSPTLSASEDQVKQKYFSSWGYKVVLISADETEKTLASAAANSSVVYVSEEVDPEVIGHKLDNVATGIVSEEGGLADEFGLAIAGSYIPGVSKMLVLSTSHYITSGYVKEIEVGQKQSGLIFKGTGGDVMVLGGFKGYSSMLALEKGGLRFDRTPSAGRRVMMPMGADDFKFSFLNGNGFEIWKRSLMWAGGEGTSIVSDRLGSTLESLE